MVKTCSDPNDQETSTIIAVGLAVKLPIMMPGMDPAQFEQDGGTTFNAYEPTATQEEKKTADANNAKRESKKEEEQSQNAETKQNNGEKVSTKADEKELDNHDKGAIGEAIAHQTMLDSGYIPLGKTDGIYRPGHTGIDGVYEVPLKKRPPTYVIVEAKHNGAQLKNFKDANNNNVDRQMSDSWVASKKPDRLKKAGLKRAQRDEIRKGLEKGKPAVGKVLIRTNNQGLKRATKVKQDGYLIRGNSGKFDL
jgi:hypothetical protein